MTTLYMPVARLGEDVDYFPVSDDGDGLQFYARKPEAVKAAESHIKDNGGDFYVLEFKAYKTKSVISQPRKSATNYEWQCFTNAVRPPQGRKVHIKAVDTVNGWEVEDVAWRVGRSMWNWKQSGKIVSVPSNIEIWQWRLPRGQLQ